MSEFFDTPIADVITLQNDKKAQLKTPEYQSSGVLPIIDQGSKFICGYTDDLSKKYSKSLPVIVFGDHTLHTKYIDFDFAVGADGTQVIKTQDPHHQHKYLYYVISREIMMMGSEGYKRHLKILRGRVVPFTNSVPEQKKIASILTSVDEVIENTQKQIDKLQDLKKATMNELLTKGIGHTEFKDSELGRIPKSWEVGKVDDITTKVVDGPHSTPKYLSSGIPFVTVRNITSGEIEFTNLKYISEADYEEFMRRGEPDLGDILYSKDGSIGYTAIVKTENRFAYFVSVALIKIKHELVLSNFLNNALQSEYVWTQTELMMEGSGLKHMVLRSIKALKIALPSMPEQQKISQVIHSMDELIGRHTAKLSQTQSLKKSLMQDLLTGKVRVTVN